MSDQMNNVQECKLYVVDDDEGYRKSLVHLLNSADYSVESFPSAQDFLDSVSDAHETGVLMLDLRMPGMDGFALQKRLNELAGRLEIVFITADAQPGDRERAFRSGAAAFLQKPLQEETLFETLHSALGRCQDKNQKMGESNERKKK